MRALILPILLAISPAAGLACSLAVTLHTLAEDEQRIDKKPPAAVEASVVSVKRGRGPVAAGNGLMSASSCDDLGFITVRIDDLPGDDRTPDISLGYLVIPAGGTWPKTHSFPEKAVRGLEEGSEISLAWIDGATDEQEAIEFAFSIVVVDLAGNQSEPSDPIWVRDAGSSSADCH